MKKIKNLLVCLDLSAYDASCVKGAAYMANTIDSISQITLLHNIRFDFLTKVDGFDQQDYKNLEEKIVNDIHNKYAAAFQQCPSKVTIKVTHHNKTTEAILPLLGDGDTLLISGLKHPQDGLGILPQMVMQIDTGRNPHLLCSKKMNLPFQHVVIASELNKNISNLLERYQFVNQYLHLPITLLSILRLPAIYFPFLSIDQSSLIEISASDTVDIPPDISAQYRVKNYVRKSSNNIASAISEYYHDSDANLLVVSRNKKEKSQFAIGKTTLKLLEQKHNKPIYIV